MRHSTSTIFVLIAIIMLLSGCMLGPQPEPPGATEDASADWDGIGDDGRFDGGGTPEPAECESGFVDEYGNCDMAGGDGDADPDADDEVPGDMGRDSLAVPAHELVDSPIGLDDVVDGSDDNDPTSATGDYDDAADRDDGFDGTDEDDDDDDGGYLLMSL